MITLLKVVVGSISRLTTHNRQLYENGCECDKNNFEKLSGSEHIFKNSNETQAGR